MKGSWEAEARPHGEDGELDVPSVSLRQVGDASPPAPPSMSPGGAVPGGCTASDLSLSGSESMTWSEGKVR